MHPTLLKFVLCSIVVLGMFGPCSATPARVGAAGRAVGPVPAPPPVRARISQGATTRPGGTRYIIPFHARCNNPMLPMRELIIAITSKF